MLSGWLVDNVDRIWIITVDDVRMDSISQANPSFLLQQHLSSL